MRVWPKHMNRAWDRRHEGHRRRDARCLVGYVVPGFDQQRLKKLPAAAIRHVLQDKRIHVLNIGMRLKEEIDANMRILSMDTTTRWKIERCWRSSPPRCLKAMQSRR